MSERLPTDFELTSLVFSMWSHSSNLEAGNIISCMHSQLRLKGAPSEAWRRNVHQQLKDLVRAGKLRRQRFLPGRPYYTIP